MHGNLQVVVIVRPKAGNSPGAVPQTFVLAVHEPTLAGETDAAAVAVVEQGREVGKLARQLFPYRRRMRSNPFEVSVTTTARRLTLGHLGWPQSA